MTQRPCVRTPPLGNTISFDHQLGEVVGVHKPPPLVRSNSASFWTAGSSSPKSNNPGGWPIQSAKIQFPPGPPALQIDWHTTSLLTMLLVLLFGLVARFSEAMMPNGFRRMRHRLTRQEMKRSVNSTCAATNTSNDTVEHDHRRIRSVAVDSSRANLGIIFPNGGWYRPFCGRNLSSA